MNPLLTSCCQQPRIKTFAQELRYDEKCQTDTCILVAVRILAGSARYPPSHTATDFPLNERLCSSYVSPSLGAWFPQSSTGFLLEEC